LKYFSLIKLAQQPKKLPRQDQLPLFQYFLYREINKEQRDKLYSSNPFDKAYFSY